MSLWKFPNSSLLQFSSLGNDDNNSTDGSRAGIHETVPIKTAHCLEQGAPCRSAAELVAEMIRVMVKMRGV